MRAVLKTLVVLQENFLLLQLQFSNLRPEKNNQNTALKAKVKMHSELLRRSQEQISTAMN